MVKKKAAELPDLQALVGVRSPYTGKETQYTVYIYSNQKKLLTLWITIPYPIYKIKPPVKTGGFPEPRYRARLKRCTIKR